MVLLQDFFTFRGQKQFCRIKTFFPQIFRMVNFSSHKILLKKIYTGSFKFSFKIEKKKTKKLFFCGKTTVNPLTKEKKTVPEKRKLRY
jgi:hypothetical protein